MEIAKLDLELKKIFENEKKCAKEFIEDYKEIISDTNKYLKELQKEYKKAIKIKENNLDEKISSLLIIIQHLEKVSTGDLNKSDKLELKYDLRLVLDKIDELKKEKDLFKK